MRFTNMIRAEGNAARPSIHLGRHFNVLEGHFTLLEGPFFSPEPLYYAGTFEPHRTLIFKR